MAWKCMVMALSVLAAIAVNGDLSTENDAQAFVDSINSKQSSWTATKRDVTSLKNQLLQNQLNADIHTLAMLDSTVDTHEVTVNTRDMPLSYDASVEYPDCNIRKIKYQNECGCCWAVSSASVMQDRLCMHSQGKIKVEISAAHLVACCKACAIGCGAGSPLYAFGFMMREGIVTGGEYDSQVGCFPFPLCPYCDRPEQGFECPAICPNTNYPTPMQNDRYYAKQLRMIKSSRGAPAIQQELFSYGPVVVAIYIHEDFMYYSSGIYRYTEGNFVAGHYVRLIGYGTENGVDYWIGMNSWQDWGEDGKGSFRVLRGVNESGIEGFAIAAMPVIPGEY